MADDIEVGLGRLPDRSAQLNGDSWLGKKAAEARAAGVGWDDFKTAVNEKWQKANEAGASDQDVMTAMGFKNPMAIDGRIRDHVGSALNSVKAPDEVEGIVGSFQAGARASVTGMLTNMAVRGSGLPNSVLGDKPSFGERMSYQAGQLLGDWPTMFLGMSGGPATAYALPVAIKQAITDGYSNGAFQSKEDAARRIASVSWETMKAAAEGKAFDVAGGAAGQYLNKFGNTLGTEVSKLVAGFAGAQTTQSLLEWKIPSMEELTDSAVGLLALHGVIKAHEHAPVVKRNMMDRWTATDKSPSESAHEAITKPDVYTDLVAKPQGRAEPGSSVNDTHDEQEKFVISRPKGNFDETMKEVLQMNEPGMRYGINAKHNPGVDLDGLDPHTAAGILHEKYWKPLGLEDVHPDIATDVMKVASRDGLDAAQKVMDLASDVPKMLEGPKEGESEKPTVDEAVKKLVGPDTAKTIPAIIEALKNNLKPETPAGGGGGGNEPPKQIPSGATPRPERGPGAYEWANPWEKAREAMSSGGPNKPMTQGWFQSVYQSLFNQKSPVLRMWKAVRGGEPIPDSDNMMYHLRNEESSSSRSRWVIENHLKPVLDTIKPNEMDDFVTYITAFRANAEHENGVKNPMDKIAARQVLDQAQHQYGDRFATALRGLADYRGKLMEYMRDKGMISATDFEKYTNERAYGVPGWRESDLVQPRQPGSRVFNPVRRVEGSDQKYINPLEALVRDTITRIGLADRNATNLALMKAAVPAGLAEVKNAPKAKTYNADEVTDLHDNGVIYDTMHPGPFNAGETTNMIGMTHFGENSEAALHRWFGGEVKPDEVPVFDNGVRKLVTFSDPEVTKVLREYDERGAGVILKAVRAVTNPVRGLIIKNPMFGPAIATMDQVFQSLKPGGLVGKNSAPANFVVGLFHSFLPTGMWDEAVRNGAITHAFDKMSKDELVKDIMSGKEDKGMWERAYNTVNSPLEWWMSHWLSAPSVGSYARSVGRGESILQSQARASEAVFHRSGFGGNVGRNINAAVPFFLAHLNGLEKTAKMAFSGENDVGEKYNPASFYAKGIGLITVPALLAWAAYKDKDWYKAMPDYERGNYIPFRVGGDGPDGTTYKFRLPPGVSTMFSDVPRRMMESIVEKDPHAWDRISSTLMESFAPPGSRTFAPSILTPAMEMALNHSFVSGRPLVSDSEMKMLPLARYRPYTTETAKSIGEFLGNTRLTRGLGISAIEIDHMIQGWGGNMGMSALKTVEGLVGGGKEEMKWSDLPIFNGIRSRYPSASAQPIQDFRDRMDKYDQVHNTLLHAMKENNLDQFKNVLHQYPEMSVMHKWQLSKDTKAQMPANAGDFFDALQSVAKSQKMDEESAGNALANQKALQNLSLISRMIHNNANGKLKPGEKSQMLDQTFLLMQKLGERGNQYLDKAGMK